MWIAEKVTESEQRAEQVALFPLGPPPYIQRHDTAKWVAPPWRIPKAPPLTTKRHTETKKYDPNVRTD